MFEWFKKRHYLKWILIVIVSLIIGFFIKVNQIDTKADVKQEVRLVSRPPVMTGHKIRVGYIESSSTPESTGILYASLKALGKNKVLSNMETYEYIPFKEDTKNLWKYVCDQGDSDYLTFEKDFFYNLEQTDEKVIQGRLEKGDIDLLITYGTRAGQAFFNNKHHVDTLNVGSNDPIAAGFMLDKHTAPYEHLWAFIDESVYRRQIDSFYKAVRFKKLGVVEYSDSFRSVFTPMKDLKEAAKKYGFELVVYPFLGVDKMFGEGDMDTYYQEVLKSNRYLAEHCDAVYQVIGGYEYTDLPMLLEPLLKAKVPVFSMFGSIEVQNGALIVLGKLILMI